MGGWNEHVSMSSRISGKWFGRREENGEGGPSSAVMEWFPRDFSHFWKFERLLSSLRLKRTSSSGLS
jgi:hypothetical protein